MKSMMMTLMFAGVMVLPGPVSAETPGGDPDNPVTAAKIFAQKLRDPETPPEDDIDWFITWLSNYDPSSVVEGTCITGLFEGPTIGTRFIDYDAIPVFPNIPWITSMPGRGLQYAEGDDCKTDSMHDPSASGHGDCASILIGGDSDTDLEGWIQWASLVGHCG